MFDFKLPPLILGTSHAPVPIVQGGMGVGISMQNLAAAVIGAPHVEAAPGFQIDL